MYRLSEIVWCVGLYLVSIERLPATFQILLSVNLCKLEAIIVPLPLYIQAALALTQTLHLALEPILLSAMAHSKVSAASVTTESDVYGTDTLRFAMVGTTGTGKSALGNSILSWGLLIVGAVWGAIKRPFISRGSSQSVTVNCKRQDAIILDHKIALVDTPGFFDTKVSVEETLDELLKCICLIEPGPHAILLVIRIGRFTDEVTKGVELLRKIFGEEAINFMIVVFTGMDSLENDGIEITEFVDTMEGPCRKLLEDCKMRYIAVNNTLKPTSDENKDQVSRLLSMVEKITKDNGGRCYTNEYLEKAKKLMEEEKKKTENLEQSAENVTKSSAGTQMKSEIKSDSGGGCFASDAKVKVQAPSGDIVVKSLDEVVVGDAVQSFDPETNLVIYSPVYYIIYQDDNERVSTLRELIYEDDVGKERSLRLQPKHLVYATVNPDPRSSLALEQPPSTPIMSENVKISDILWVVNEAGRLCPRRVTRIGEVVSNVRHPMTLNHRIIVDDVLASVHMHNEWILRQATSPLRLLYKINPSLSDFWLSKKAIQAWDYVEQYLLE